MDPPRAAEAPPPTSLPPLPARFLLGMRVDVTSYDDAAERVATWVDRGESRTVCAASVNNVMQAHDDREFLQAMNDADLVVADGRPLVWGLRGLGAATATQVRGTDLMRALLATASSHRIPVAFFGGAPEVLDRLLGRVETDWPDLRVAYSFSPPFDPPTPDEDARAVRELNASGAGIVFVALGCPKQEFWLASHRGRVRDVMVGVGAAFDFLAGTKRQAPRFLQRIGLEWLFRLVSEPRRLWRRYVRHNP
ncbi:MAG: WecB/TagA/CpsF family glycosyltransferase, partial [Actinomycetota bacterium]